MKKIIMKSLAVFSLILLISSVLIGSTVYWDISRSQRAFSYNDSPSYLPEHLHDTCLASKELLTGTTNSAWYKTVTPSEAFVSERTHWFPYTCNLDQLSSHLTSINDHTLAERSVHNLPAIYNLVTRERDELFVLGGVTVKTEKCKKNSYECATGPYVAKLNAHTLKEQWRVQLYSAKESGDWDYPGAIGVHGNGHIYVINGYRVFKIDSESGDILTTNELPTASDQPKGDTVYNGFSILSDGNLIAKSMTREPNTTFDTIVALLFFYKEEEPSNLAVIDSNTLKILSSTKIAEPVLGRITNTLYQGQELIYVAGADHLIRYRYSDKQLSIDENWGPVKYRFNNQKPATAPGILNDFVIVQNNFQYAKDPLSVTAVAQYDSSVQHRTTPFKRNTWLGSIQWSLPTIDPENNRVYSYDFLANELVALNFHPNDGFSEAWRVEHRSLSFGALLGPKDKRIFVLDDGMLPTFWNAQVVWRDANTGDELLRSPTIPQGGGLPVTPGFNGVMYYLSSLDGRLTEFSLEKNLVPPNPLLTLDN